MIAPKTTNHIGRKIGRIRELRGMKQESMATELGVSQQTVSNIEKSERIEADLLAQIAAILGVTSEAIENFSEEAVVNFFNNFHDHSLETNNGAVSATGCTFNPLDKLIEAHEENRKLYERLLESERNKNSLLEKLLTDKT